jgi:hypothetical protein
MNSARKTMAEPDDEWMSVEEAMSALGHGRSTVLNLVIAKVLEARVVAKRTVIRRDSVIAELERRKASAAETEVTAAQ